MIFWKKSYFIVYSTESSYGNAIFELEKRIKSINDIKNIERKISKDNGVKALVIFWKKL